MSFIAKKIEIKFLFSINNQYFFYSKSIIINRHLKVHKHRAFCCPMHAMHLITKDTTFKKISILKLIDFYYFTPSVICGCLFLRIVLYCLKPVSCSYQKIVGVSHCCCWSI